MNWEQIKEKWNKAKGQAKLEWGKLTDDELDIIDGQRDALVEKIQEKYGIATDEADEQVAEFEKCCTC